MNRQEELLIEDGRWESWRLSAIGDGGKATISLTPDVDGTGSGSLSGFTSIYPLEKTTQWCLGGSSLSHHRWHCSTGFHSEQLLRPSCTILCLGHGPHKLTVPPWIKKIPHHFPHLESLWFFSYFYFLLSLFSLSWHLALPVPAISLLLLCLLSAILGLK